MSKFTKMVEAYTRETFTSVKELGAAINYLHDIRDALKEGIIHYSDQEKLNNWQQPGYANARDSYESKLTSVEALITQLEGKLLVGTFKEKENANS